MKLAFVSDLLEIIGFSNLKRLFEIKFLKNLRESKIVVNPIDDQVSLKNENY